MAASIFTYSSGSNQSSESEKSATDTSKAATTTTTAPAETKPASTTTTVPANVMVVVHKVKDYEKWQASFDAHDSMKMASGIHNYVVGRAAQDPNTLVVATM